MNKEKPERYKPGYLVIVRRKGDSVLIGDDIEIVTVKTSSGQTHLAIRAPGKKIIRKELKDKKPRVDVDGNLKTYNY